MCRNSTVELLIFMVCALQVKGSCVDQSHESVCRSKGDVPLGSAEFCGNYRIHSDRYVWIREVHHRWQWTPYNPCKTNDVQWMSVSQLAVLSGPRKGEVERDSLSVLDALQDLEITGKKASIPMTKEELRSLLGDPINGSQYSVQSCAGILYFKQANDGKWFWSPWKDGKYDPFFGSGGTFWFSVQKTTVTGTGSSYDGEKPNEWNVRTIKELARQEKLMVTAEVTATVDSDPQQRVGTREDNQSTWVWSALVAVVTVTIISAAWGKFHRPTSRSYQYRDAASALRSVARQAERDYFATLEQRAQSALLALSQEESEIGGSEHSPVRESKPGPESKGEECKSSFASLISLPYVETLPDVEEVLKLYSSLQDRVAVRPEERPHHMSLLRGTQADGDHAHHDNHHNDHATGDDDIADLEGLDAELERVSARETEARDSPGGKVLDAAVASSSFNSWLQHFARMEHPLQDTQIQPELLVALREVYNRQAPLATACTDSQFVELLIGGKQFSLLRSTILKHPHCFFALALSWKQATTQQGTISVDRDPQVFPLVQRYMREGLTASFVDVLRRLSQANLLRLLQEVHFYMLSELADAIQLLLLGVRETFIDCASVSHDPAGPLDHMPSRHLPDVWRQLQPIEDSFENVERSVRLLLAIDRDSTHAQHLADACVVDVFSQMQRDPSPWQRRMKVGLDLSNFRMSRRADPNQTLEYRCFASASEFVQRLNVITAGLLLRLDWSNLLLVGEVPLCALRRCSNEMSARKSSQERRQRRESRRQASRESMRNWGFTTDQITESLNPTEKTDTHEAKAEADGKESNLDDDVRSLFEVFCASFDGQLNVGLSLVFCLTTENHDEAESALRRLSDTIQRNMRSGSLLTHMMYRSGRHARAPLSCDNRLVMVRSRDAVYFLTPEPFLHVTVLLRVFPSIPAALVEMDVDCMSVGYDGRTVYATARACGALLSGVNQYRRSRVSKFYEKRLWRAELKFGFRTHVDFFAEGHCPSSMTEPLDTRNYYGPLTLFDDSVSVPSSACAASHTAIDRSWLACVQALNRSIRELFVRNLPCGFVYAVDDLDSVLDTAKAPTRPNRPCYELHDAGGTPTSRDRGRNRPWLRPRAQESEFPNGLREEYSEAYPEDVDLSVPLELRAVVSPPPSVLLPSKVQFYSGRRPEPLLGLQHDFWPPR